MFELRHGRRSGTKPIALRPGFSGAQNVATRQSRSVVVMPRTDLDASLTTLTAGNWFLPMHIYSSKQRESKSFFCS